MYLLYRTQFTDFHGFIWLTCRYHSTFYCLLGFLSVSLQQALWWNLCMLLNILEVRNNVSKPNSSSSVVAGLDSFGFTAYGKFSSPTQGEAICSQVVLLLLLLLLLFLDLELLLILTVMLLLPPPLMLIIILILILGFPGILVASIISTNTPITYYYTCG